MVTKCVAAEAADIDAVVLSVQLTAGAAVAPEVSAVQLGCLEAMDALRPYKYLTQPKGLFKTISESTTKYIYCTRLRQLQIGQIYICKQTICIFVDRLWLLLARRNYF